MAVATIDALKARAHALLDRIEGRDRRDAVLDVVHDFIVIIEDTHRDVLDTVETKLLHKDHH